MPQINTATLLKAPSLNTLPIDFTVRIKDNRRAYYLKRDMLRIKQTIAKMAQQDVIKHRNRLMQQGN